MHLAKIDVKIPNSEGLSVDTPEVQFEFSCFIMQIPISTSVCDYTHIDLVWTIIAALLHCWADIALFSEVADVHVTQQSPAGVL